MVAFIVAKCFIVEILLFLINHTGYGSFALHNCLLFGIYIEFNYFDFVLCGDPFEKKRCALSKQ